jgi:hypothetical protein
MGKNRSWDDFEPEERDYFNDRHKKGNRNRNFKEPHGIQLPEAKKGLKRLVVKSNRLNWEKYLIR